MRKVMRGAAACLLSGIFAGHALGQVNVDLNHWQKEGPSSAGNWVVEPDGSNVLQTINGAPTYFVSNVDFYNTTIRGSFGVETGSDDDFIGFVFGYQGPFSEQDDSPLMVDYLLFDWKQNNQSGATSGFRLSYLQGEQTGSSNAGTPMWQHVSSGGLVVEQLASRTGPGLGWADNTVYDFELLYQADRIRINVQGGTGDLALGQTIFDVNLADVDPEGSIFGGAFPEGRFGFYNYSQASVRYQSFTEEADPVLSVSSTDVNFGAVRVGTNASADVTIANAGGLGAATLLGQVESASGVFAGPDETGFALGEGEASDKTFTFAPTSRGTFDQQLLVTSNAPRDAEAILSLMGEGVSPVFASDQTPGTTLDLGIADSGVTTALVLTIGNISDDDNGGNDDLTDLTLDFVLSGVDAALFSVDLVPGTRVGQGDDVELLVTFLGAESLGDYAATLTLQTDEGAALGDTVAGASYSYDLAVTVAPEPATLALIGLGVLTMARRRSR